MVTEKSTHSKKTGDDRSGSKGMQQSFELMGEENTGINQQVGSNLHHEQVKRTKKKKGSSGRSSVSPRPVQKILHQTAERFRRNPTVKSEVNSAAGSSSTAIVQRHAVTAPLDSLHDIPSAGQTSKLKKSISLRNQSVPDMTTSKQATTFIPCRRMHFDQTSNVRQLGNSHEYMGSKPLETVHPSKLSLEDIKARLDTNNARLHEYTPTYDLSSILASSDAETTSKFLTSEDKSSFYGSGALLRTLEEDNLQTSSTNDNNIKSHESLDPKSYQHPILYQGDHLNTVFSQDSILKSANTNKQRQQSGTAFSRSSNVEPSLLTHRSDQTPYSQPASQTEISRSQLLCEVSAVSDLANSRRMRASHGSTSNTSSDSSSPFVEPLEAWEGGSTDSVFFDGVMKEELSDKPNAKIGCLSKLLYNKKWCIILFTVAATVAVCAAVLIPTAFIVLRSKEVAAKEPISTDESAYLGPDRDPIRRQPPRMITPTRRNTSVFTPYRDTQIPKSYKGGIFDVSTWKDKSGFNTTFTDMTVGGLPIMGLNSTWDNSAQANPYVPPLEDKFSYGKLPIRGVNLGGWLVLEPFITPSLFSKYDLKLGIVDEWTLINYVNSTKGIDAVVNLMETHYSTFVTEDTFKEIRAAGLDHVRIPIGYWSVRTWKGDSFLPKISWRYLLRGLEWARKYGIRVNLDLHSVPGGQNGWNHSGRQGVLSWMNGNYGYLNGERALEIHNSLAEFFAQDRYTDLVTIYGLVNEPNMMALNSEQIKYWTEIAYELVRDKGYEGVISFGDGFLGVDRWKDVFPSDDFPDMALDVHQYTIFDVGLIQMSHTSKIDYVCNAWSDQIARSSSTSSGHGSTFVGEWSQAGNDCVKYLNNVGSGSRWEGNLDLNNPGQMACHGNMNCSCAISNADPSTYSPIYKKFLLNFAEVQMEVFESNGGWGSMYWAWDTETIESTLWSYKKARDAGLMPQLAYDRTYNCSMETPNYEELGLPEYY